VKSVFSGIRITINENRLYEVEVMEGTSYLHIGNYETRKEAFRKARQIFNAEAEVESIREQSRQERVR